MKIRKKKKSIKKVKNTYEKRLKEKEKIINELKNKTSNGVKIISRESDNKLIESDSDSYLR